MGWVKKVEKYLSKWSSPAVRKESEAADARFKLYSQRHSKYKNNKRPS
jgi:hypothetical protein